MDAGSGFLHGCLCHRTKHDEVKGWHKAEEKKDEAAD